MRIIPKPVQNWVSNPKTAEFVENTIFAVSVETGLKMVGRPTFIMLDKQADSEEKKKYAAVKEMLYQGICLTLYLSVMQKFIKPLFYKWISNALSKNPKVDPNGLTNKFKIDEYNAMYEKIHNLEIAKKEGAKELTDKAAKKAFKDKKLAEILDLKEIMRKEERFHLGKGAKELSAIIGSILMLTVVAPQISHFIIHPIMKSLGFEKSEGGH